MQQSDLVAFRQVLADLGVVFGKEITDDLVRAYWGALADLALSTVRYHATLATKHGKYFPKPAELRPKVEAPTLARSQAMDYAFRDGLERASANLDQLWRDDRASWKRIVSARVYLVGRRLGMPDAVIAERLETYAPR